MSRRTAAWVAWSVCAVSLLIMALGLLVVFFGWIWLRERRRRLDGSRHVPEMRD